MSMNPSWQGWSGARVVKTSIAAGLALYFASFLNSPGYTYSALVAVLATQKSLARSFGLAKYQVLSALVGTFSGNLAAWKFGSYPLIAGLLVYALFVIHLRLGWKDTILMSIVTAVNSFATFEGELIVHSAKQVAIILIGIASSIAVNLLSVPRYEEKLEDLIDRSEGMLRSLIYLMHHNLSHLDQKFPQEGYENQVAEVRKYIAEARHYAGLIFEDQWIYNRKGREAQQAVQTLEQMDLLTTHISSLYKFLGRVDIWLEPIPKIQRLMEIVMQVQVRTFCQRPVPERLIDKAIQNMDCQFDQMDLPKTRLEFMTRSALYHLYNDLKIYYEDLKVIRRMQK